MQAVAAFSPNEYLKKINLADSIRGLAIPTYGASARKEIAAAAKILRFMKTEHVSRYRPSAEGLATELDEQGVDCTDLHSAAATGVAKVGGVDVVITIRLEKRKGGESFD